jgi:very-short-patch-repair endonuclease
MLLDTTIRINRFTDKDSNKGDNVSSFNTYSIQSYIDKGCSEIEAFRIVEENKKATSQNLKESLAVKRLKSLSYDDIDSIRLLEIEDHFEKSYKISKSRLHNFVKKVKDVFKITTEEAVKQIDFVCLEVSKKHKRITSNKMFYSLLFGIDSDEYKEYNNICKSYASCSFEKFSAEYEDKNQAKKDFNIKYGSLSIEHIMNKHKCSEEEAIIIQKERLDKMAFANNSKSDEEKKKINESKKNNIENFTKRFGPILGPLKYYEYLDRKKGIGSKKWYIEKYGEIEGPIRFEKKKVRNSHWRKEYWIDRGYNEEEAAVKLKEIFETRPSFSKKYCIEKYGYTKGIRIWKERQLLWQKSLYSNMTEEEKTAFEKSKGLDKEAFIKKHGEEKYTSTIENRINSLSSSSKEATRFFIKLYTILRKCGIIEKKEPYFAVKGSKEKSIYSKDHKRVFFYDFCIENLKVIVEYHGIAFHPKPKDFMWKPIVGNLDYQSKLEYDRMKENFAIENGYEHLVVWSDSNLDEELNRVAETIFNIYEEKEMK